MNIFRWARNLLIAGGILLLVGCGLFAQHTSSFLAHARTADGRITRLIVSGRASQRVRYYPEFQFIDDAGKTRTQVSRTGSNPAGYVPGQAVQVRYLEGQAGDARIAGFWQLWLGTVICGFMGVVWLGLGLIFGVVVRRQGTV